MNAAETSPNHAKRARAILLAARGTEVSEIAATLGRNPASVFRWIHRYTEEGVDGLSDRPRRRHQLADEIAAVDRKLLASWRDSAEVDPEAARRAGALLLLADGVPLKTICQRIGISGPILWKWRHRYWNEGVEGLRSRGAAPLRLDVPPRERAVLHGWSEGDGEGAGDERASRARIVLLAANRTSTTRIAVEVGRSVTAVRRWIRRYRDGGLEGLWPADSAARRPPVELSDEDRSSLLWWVDAPDTPQTVVRRARAVVLAADGMRIKDIATGFGVQPGSVGDWLRRYRTEGIGGLLSRTGGRTPKHATLRLPVRDREMLALWAESPELKSDVVRRARAVLLTADGETPADAAAWLRASSSSVLKWLDRYVSDGLVGVRGRQPGDRAETDEALVVLATLESPLEWCGAGRWSSPLLADTLGHTSEAVVHRVWSRWGLRPSRGEPPRFASVPPLEAYGWEIVGLFLNPPDRVLALGPSDTGEDGIARLRQCLESGPVPATGTTAPRHEQLLAFLERIAVDTDQLRLICEPGGSHQHRRIAGWLARHADIGVHLPPISVSWRTFAKAWLGITARRWSKWSDAFADADAVITGTDRYTDDSASFTWVAG